ncbi:caspase [Apiospora phragmitis]|uniref:Caspase n=1 Tax=Apiospora phragmitis TaxID=2905665 RepID=A0ABR1WR25_9PEZI
MTTHYALLIGNCYCDGTWGLSLKGCARDVIKIKAQPARSSAGIDIEVLAAGPKAASDSGRPGEVEGAELPTHSNVLSSLEDIIARASAGNFVYIHFSGHSTAITPDSGSPFSNGSTGGPGAGRAPRSRLGAPSYPGKSLSLHDGSAQPSHRDASLRPNWLVDPDGYTILTACGPREVAKELKFGTDEWYGALSYFLIRAFVRYGRVGGWQHHVYAHVCGRFRDLSPEQNQMLYGSMGLWFFGEACITDETASIVVVRKKGQRDLGQAPFQLEAGEAHGVCKGDRFALHGIIKAQETASSMFSSSEDHQVVAEVMEVRALTSDLRETTQTTKELGSGLTATPITHLDLRRFPIKLDLYLPHPDIWIEALRQHYVLDTMEHLVKFKAMEVLTNKALTDTFTRSIDVHVVDSDGTVHLPGCRYDGPFATGCSHQDCIVNVRHGDKLRLKVKNKEDEGGRDLYIHLYNMACSRWDVENISGGDYRALPPRSSNQDEDDYKSGTTGEWKPSLHMKISEELLAMGHDNCEDIIKVILTSAPTSFMCLELPKIANHARPDVKTGKFRGGSGKVSEDWAALNFRPRTQK